MSFVSEYSAAAGPQEKRAAAERALLRLILAERDAGRREAEVLHRVRLCPGASTVDWLDAILMTLEIHENERLGVP